MNGGQAYVWTESERERIQLSGLRLHWDEFYQLPQRRRVAGGTA